MMKPSRSDLLAENGFTLIEMLVALAIFSIISVMTFQGLKVLVNMEEKISKERSRFTDLQRIVNWMVTDIRGLAPRPVYIDSEGYLPALVINGTEPGFALTRSGWRNPAQLKRSTYQRVAYKLSDEGALSRAYWLTLERMQGAEPIEVVLLTDVEELSVRVLSVKDVWHSIWPPEAGQNAGSTGVKALKAMEFTIKHRHYGDIRRLISLQ